MKRITTVPLPRGDILSTPENKPGHRLRLARRLRESDLLRYFGLIQFFSPFFIFFSLFLIACNRAADSTSSPPPSPSRPSAIIDSPIFVTPFQNQTLEILPATSFLKETLIRWNFNVVSDPKEAVWVLTEVIHRVEKTPASLNREGKAVEYRMTIGVSYSLSAVGKKEPLFSWDDTADADWEAKSDLGADRAAQDRAIRETVWNLSQKAAITLKDFFRQRPESG